MPKYPKRRQHHFGNEAAFCKAGRRDVSEIGTSEIIKRKHAHQDKAQWSRKHWASGAYHLVGTNHELPVLPPVKHLTFLCLGALVCNIKSGTWLLWRLGGQMTTYMSGTEPGTDSVHKASFSCVPIAATSGRVILTHDMNLDLAIPHL